jgi:hypothetical protein
MQSLISGSVLPVLEIGLEPGERIVGRPAAVSPVR